MIALALLAGCGAELEEDAALDAPGGPADAAVDAAVDAPIDARPCVGGQARTTDADGTCWVFYTSPATWADAQAACVAAGSQLAIIKTAQANQVVTSLIGAVDAFVGARDVAVEGTFVWGDGTALTYTNWRTGEPNNGNGTFEEDCLIVEGALGGSWDDRPCAPPPTGTGAYAYVCQY